MQKHLLSVIKMTLANEIKFAKKKIEDMLHQILYKDNFEP